MPLVQDPGYSSSFHCSLRTWFSWYSHTKGQQKVPFQLPPQLLSKFQIHHWPGAGVEGQGSVEGVGRAGSPRGRESRVWAGPGVGSRESGGSRGSGVSRGCGPGRESRAAGVEGVGRAGSRESGVGRESRVRGQSRVWAGPGVPGAGVEGQGPVEGVGRAGSGESGPLGSRAGVEGVGRAGSREHSGVGRESRVRGESRVWAGPGVGSREHSGVGRECGAGVGWGRKSGVRWGRESGVGSRESGVGSGLGAGVGSALGAGVGSLAIWMQPRRGGAEYTLRGKFSSPPGRRRSAGSAPRRVAGSVCDGLVAPGSLVAPVTPDSGSPQNSWSRLSSAPSGGVPVRSRPVCDGMRSGCARRSVLPAWGAPLGASLFRCVNMAGEVASPAAGCAVLCLYAFAQRVKREM
jgi:hypothetical protein